MDFSIVETNLESNQISKVNTAMIGHAENLDRNGIAYIHTI